MNSHPKINEASLTELLKRLRETLEKEGIDSSSRWPGSLEFKLKIPRFVPFDDYYTLIRHDLNNGHVYFVLNFIFFLWEDWKNHDPGTEEYNRRAELVDWKLIPSIYDFFADIGEKYNLKLELEIDESADISLEGVLESYKILDDLIKGIRQISADWKGSPYKEKAWEWAMWERGF